MPSPDQLIKYRQALTSFVDFSEEQWLIFSEHLYVREIKKRQLFAVAGKICTEIGFIVSGSFRFYIDRDGVEISNYFCFETDLISSYKSFLKQEPGFSNVEALEDAILVCFNHKSLQCLLNDERIAFKMERFGRLIAEYLICCYEDRLLTFVTQTPEERYLELLESQPSMVQRIPQYYLANFLGITPVPLSRIRKRLLDEASVKNQSA